MRESKGPADFAAEQIHRIRNARKVFKTFTPCGNLVAVDVHKFDQTEAGIMLPDGSRDERTNPFGVVIACGPDCKWVKEGDIILGQNEVRMAEVNFGGSGPVYVINENQILGISLSSPRFKQIQEEIETSK